MSSFLFALQFLTIIPVKIKELSEYKQCRSMIYFPLVGLLLGMILAGLNNLFFNLGFNQFTLSVITVVTLVILTGGLHLDGLSDTADAFLSRKSKDEMLGIMRDSHIGVMGVLSITCAILLKISFLYSIGTELKMPALLLMCVLSRWALVAAIFIFPYARGEGKAKVFFEGIDSTIFIPATLFTALCVAMIWQIKGLLIFALIALSTCLIGKFIQKKIGGITGDTLGAINEITEVSTLFFVLIAGSVWT